MHPFSLTKDEVSQVAGGIAPSWLISQPLFEDGDVIPSDPFNEAGGPIYVTMAIPEDGNDPRIFDLKTSLGVGA